MIDITGLREDKRPQSSTIVHALLDRLEAAEAEALEEARLNGMGSEREAALMAKLEAAERERDECNRRLLEAADHFAAQTALMKQKYDDLRVKVAEMERQDPVGKFVQHPSNGLWEQDGYGDNPDANPLYALPGAQAQPAPSMPDGWKLVPIEPTPTMITAALESSHAINAHRAEYCYRAMLAAAPEAKP